MTPIRERDLFSATQPGTRPTGELKDALARGCAIAEEYTPWRKSLATRFAGANGKPDARLRLPHPARRFPYPRPEFWELIQSRNAADGYNGYSPQEQPVFGNPVPGTAFHVSSALVRPVSGEFSLAAAVASADRVPGYSPSSTFGYLQQNSASASLAVSFYHPELPSRGCDEVSASITLTADHVWDALTTFSAPASGNSLGAIYGQLTVSLMTGLFEPTASESNWSEFIRFESSEGNQDTSYVALQPGDGPITPVSLSVAMPYDKKSTLFVVVAAMEIDCCMMVDGSGQGAACDLRFGDDDSLKVYEDGIYADYDPLSCPLQISNFSLYGRFAVPGK